MPQLKQGQGAYVDDIYRAAQTSPLDGANKFIEFVNDFRACTGESETSAFTKAVTAINYIAGAPVMSRSDISIVQAHLNPAVCEAIELARKSLGVEPPRAVSTFKLPPAALAK
ncbi:MAG TPA: hypothetical protein VFR09_09550 [Alphaproteobacteria bacterium]|nr:hypothetical protein [Alphaproteobacteria bacterium]